jgi:ATP-dependent RNA helicase DeaD
VNRPPQKSGGRPRRPRSTGASRVEPAEALHPVDEVPDIKSFAEWDLGDAIQDAIAAMGIVSPTPIQALAIGPVLEGRDVIAKAETGTGKTLAFGAPMMARMDPQRSSVLALVMCPTRELTEQVYRVLEDLGRASNLSVALIVGGEEMRPQVDALQSGAQVVVGTPGRILDLMNQGFLTFPWTEFAVLDEADKMLEIGFIDDVRKILKAIPDERQTLLFSATFPPSLLSLARESTKNPAEIATAKGLATVDSIRQFFIKVDGDRRPQALAKLLSASNEEDVFLVFCERRTDVDRLLRWMERERFPVKALHGGYDQASRFRVMSAFREGSVKVLLATDVASRGLDVDHVSHVLNFGVPRDISDYTHRIGRTGRAGRKGTSITFVTPEDERKWRALIGGAPWSVEELQPGDISTAASLPVSESPDQPAPAAKPRSNSAARRDAEPSGGGRDRQQRPEREARVADDRQKRDERSPAKGANRPAPASSSFGLGISEPEPEKPKQRQRPERSKPQNEQPEPPAPPKSPGPSGFGAGL